MGRFLLIHTLQQAKNRGVKTQDAPQNQRRKWNKWEIAKKARALRDRRAPCSPPEPEAQARVAHPVLVANEHRDHLPRHRAVRRIAPAPSHPPCVLPIHRGWIARAGCVIPAAQILLEHGNAHSERAEELHLWNRRQNTKRAQPDHDLGRDHALELLQILGHPDDDD